MLPISRSPKQLLVLGILAGGAVLLGGCSAGPRERWQSARADVIPLQPCEPQVAYFQVQEDIARTSLSEPVLVTASSESIAP